MDRLRAFALNAALVAAALVVGLGLVEALLRLFQPVELRIRGGDIDLPYFKRYELHASSGNKLDRDIIHSRNALGFRGENPPPDVAGRLTILAIGGSTTEGFYLSDGRTWPELAGSGLRATFPSLWINNAGLSGHSTFGHLRLMDQYIATLRPKDLLFLIGINDRAKADASLSDKSLEMEDRSTVARLKRALLRHSEAAALLWNIVRTLRSTELGIENKEYDFTKLKPRPLPPDAGEAELVLHGSVFVEAFGARVAKLVEKSRAIGALPVLITQPALYGLGIDPPTGVNLATLPAEPVNGAVAWRTLELYNDETRRRAAAAQTPLIDLARRLPKDSTLFYDYIHFSKLGAEAAAVIVATQLCPILKETFPNESHGDCPPSRMAER